MTASSSVRRRTSVDPPPATRRRSSTRRRSARHRPSCRPPRRCRSRRVPNGWRARSACHAPSSPPSTPRAGAPESIARRLIAHPAPVAGRPPPPGHPSTFVTRKLRPGRKCCRKRGFRAMACGLPLIRDTHRSTMGGDRTGDAPRLHAVPPRHAGDEVRGLTPEQLAERSVPPSSMSLIGLVRHMTDVERSWFRRVGMGEGDDTAGPDPLRARHERRRRVRRRLGRRPPRPTSPRGSAEMRSSTRSSPASRPRRDPSPRRLGVRHVDPLDPRAHDRGVRPPQRPRRLPPRADRRRDRASDPCPSFHVCVENLRARATDRIATQTWNDARLRRARRGGGTRSR